MRCEAAKDLVEPYLDDELDAALKAQVEEHLTDCGACAETRTQLAGLRAAIRARAPYYNAPAYLQERIRNNLPNSGSSEWQFWRPTAVAAGILLAASLTWNFALLRPRAVQPDPISQQVLASHIRSLIGTHLLDVTSSDHHTVKPWFNGKLDFSPEVRDLSPQGFPLIGGRVDYLSERPVAALVYGRRQHLINVFTWPSTSPEREVTLTRNGYNAVHWSDKGMTWWAVSDLNLSELRQFENFCKQ
jgi:anti-sigma factor RsiW